VAYKVTQLNLHFVMSYDLFGDEFKAPMSYIELRGFVPCALTFFPLIY